MIASSGQCAHGSAHGLLADVLRPLPLETFFDEYWGRAPVHVPGWRGKFAECLPWHAVNRVLAEHRLEHPRLRLFKDGILVEREQYVRFTTIRAGIDTPIPRLLASEFVDLLRDGATMVLDGVDELYGPLSEFAKSLEGVFHEYIRVNAYAAWRTARGFDIHWDDHDVLILQVAGRKDWAIHGSTYQYPLTSNRRHDTTPPAAPVWTGLLSDGDLLYIPRGWWHVAHPLDEPSLHLTVSITSGTGIDLMLWLVEQLKGATAMRQDLPKFSGLDEQKAHAALLRSAVTAALDDDVVRRYLHHRDVTAYGRPTFTLPGSASPTFTLTPSTRIRLVPPRPLTVTATGEGYSVDGNDTRWRLSAEAKAVVETLGDHVSRTVHELAAVHPTVPHAVLYACLLSLIREGLLTIVDVETAVPSFSRPSTVAPG